MEAGIAAEVPPGWSAACAQSQLAQPVLDARYALDLPCLTHNHDDAHALFTLLYYQTITDSAHSLSLRCCSPVQEASCMTLRTGWSLRVLGREPQEAWPLTSALGGSAWTRLWPLPFAPKETLALWWRSQVMAAARYLVALQNTSSCCTT